MPEFKNKKWTANIHLFSSFNFPVRKSSTLQAGLGIKQIFKDCTFWLLEKSDKRGSNFPTQKKARFFLSGDFFPTS